MYLLVFVTLIISLIGLYAQVLTLKTARLSQGQSVVAQAMLRWHEIAIEQARTTQISPVPGAAGCDLTAPGIVGTACSNPVHGNVKVATLANAPAGWLGFQCSNPTTPPCFTPLPAGYQANPYSFYSVYYIPSAGQGYVVTFVPKPAGNPGFIVLAGSATPIGITMGDLMDQIRNSGLNPMNYGTVSGGQLVTQSISTGGPYASLTYTMPSTIPPAVINGSIGIISAP